MLATPSLNSVNDSLAIAIDASRTTVARRTGTENYALQLIRGLLSLDSPHRFTLYFRDTPSPDLFQSRPNVNFKVIASPRFWTHGRFAIELWRDRPDVTFVPAHTLPIFFPGRAVVTVHDLGYRYFPETHPLKERVYLELTTRYSASRGTVILADSEATRDELIKQYHTPNAKIAVVYPGVETMCRAKDTQIEPVLLKYQIRVPYLLFLGTLQPRKNIKRLIQAFTDYVQQSHDSELTLVLAGKMGWHLDQLMPDVPPAIRERIRWTGYIDDEDIPALYSGALALTFPSLYEGFGFPVVEAMQCGTPVLCSNTSSLPELAGSAALLVDPLRTDSISAGIAKLMNDPALRTNLAERGLSQAKEFNWEHAARQALLAIEKAAHT